MRPGCCGRGSSGRIDRDRRPAARKSVYPPPRFRGVFEDQDLDCGDRHRGGLGGRSPGHRQRARRPRRSTTTPRSSRHPILRRRTFNSGGRGADWELVGTVATGNPHTDLDFFTQDGETYASVGTLGNGPNAGGQTIVQLTEGGEVAPELRRRPSVGELPQRPDRGDRPPARRRGDAEGRRAPQHDEPVRRRAATPSCSIDATDAAGRCHDQGVARPRRARRRAGSRSSTSPTRRPARSRSGCTSHIGEAHTVNVDPKRPHIAYVGRPPTRSRVDERRARGANEDPAARRPLRPRRLRGRRHVARA